jgi:transcriptional regulator of nitric oxide reductase
LYKLGVVATVDALSIHGLVGAAAAAGGCVNLEKSNNLTAVVEKYMHYIADLSRFVIFCSASTLSHPHGAPSIRQLRRGQSSSQL